MIILYIIVILLAALPLWKTIRFAILEEKIRKEGIPVSGVITHIHSMHYRRGPTTDRVHTRFNSIIAGQFHEANFVTTHNKYRIGQEVSVKYLPEKPDKIVVEKKRGYWPMLVFSIALLLFAFFAVYKIDETLKADGTHYEFRSPWKK